MKKEAFLVSTMLVASTAISFAQVKGSVVDQSTKEPLIGVTVLHEKSQEGTITDIDGKFELKVPAGKQQLKISYVGYNSATVSVSNGENVVVELDADVVALKDVTVTSSVAIARKTPVAISTIDPIVIEEKLGTQEFPELLKSTPGVYATKQGGGYGDSKINMRGFQSANIAVMVNGVPMNDMEWGGVYWSNWAGLSDVTRSMQTQRGLGASKVSAPSVGGSINILTRTTDAKKGGAVSYQMGNDGYNKVVFNVSTGLMENGWAFSILGGKTWGDGYIQGTDFEAYNYFVNISKVINSDHSLSFTAFGSPQWHNQRSNYDGLTIEGWQQVKNYMNGDSPYKYNPTYGFGRNGERKTSAHNEYHKPQLSLNHNWQINTKSSLSTSLYTSLGRGSGYSGQSTSEYSGYWYGSSDGVLNMQLRNEDGTFAYDRVYDINEASESGSQMAMSKSVNNHNWYGLLSTYTTSLPYNIDFYAGLDLRYYKGTHTNELIDLYGGDYYIDRYRKNVNAANNSAASDSEFAMRKLGVGDVVYRDYDGHVLSEGVFTQAEMNLDKLNLFVAGSLSNTTYWRYDRFYYDAENAKSDKLNFIGYTAKGGANYNVTGNHNVFGNIGYISRAPFFSGGAFLSATNSNVTNPDAVNEKIFSVEVGYGYRSRFLSANLNVYRTKWMDKTMAKTVTTQDGDRANLNMQGVDALHQGIEFDFVAKPTKWLDITGMVSIGDWKWDNDAKGYFYTSGGEPLADNKGNVASAPQAPDHASMTLKLEGTRVGGSAQTTFALGAKVKLTKDIRFGLDYTHFARNYADWAINANDIVINGEKTYYQPWEIPQAGVLDANASYSFNIGKVRAIVSGNVQNLLDQTYITDAYDGGGQDWTKAYRVFYGYGRNYSIRLKMMF